jgi:flagellar hook-associated protein 1 FlgK
MPGLNASLNIGLSGLEAAQGALNVVGHNIANVNTPNYSRQQVSLSANTPQVFGTLEYGTGVSLQNIMGVRDKFLDMQITQSTSRQSGADTRYAGVEGISSVFKSDGSGSDLSSLVQNFFQGFQQLAATPEDGSARTNLVGQAQSLVNGLQSDYQTLEDQRAQADQTVGTTVTAINTLTAQIASLNARISQEPTPGADSDGRDQRSALANQLAGLVGVQVFEDNHSQLQITLDSGAAVLVSGSTAYNMIATPVNNPATQETYNQVSVDMGGTSVDVTSKIKEGSLGASLDLRDNILAGYEGTLDELAAGLSSQVNLQHEKGYALDGTTTGTDFFLGATGNVASAGPPASVLPTGISAANNYKGMVNALAVNAAIVANPALIAAGGATAPGSPGDNGNANLLANLQNTTNTVDTNGDGVGDSGPFSTVLSSLVGKVGTDSQQFQTTSTTQDNLLSALQTQRDRVSGVDMDEEATNLLAYQRSYQASAHFISVIDQLTAQLMTQFAT